MFFRDRGRAQTRVVHRMTHCLSFGHVGFPTKRHPLTGKAGGGLAMDQGVSWAWFDRSRMNFVVGWASGVFLILHLACKTGILVIYLIRAMIKPTGLSPLQVSIPPELELCPRSGTLQHAWSPFDLPLAQPQKNKPGLTNRRESSKRHSHVGKILHLARLEGN